MALSETGLYLRLLLDSAKSGLNTEILLLMPRSLKQRERENTLVDQSMYMAVPNMHLSVLIQHLHQVPF